MSAGQLVSPALRAFQPAPSGRSQHASGLRPPAFSEKENDAGAESALLQSPQRPVRVGSERLLAEGRKAPSVLKAEAREAGRNVLRAKAVGWSVLRVACDDAPG